MVSDSKNVRTRVSRRHDGRPFGILNITTGMLVRQLFTLGVPDSYRSGP